MGRRKGVREGGAEMIRPFAKGRRKPGVMNGTEEKMAAFLDQKKTVGEVLQYWFEAYTFKLAPDTRYTPDFAVMLSDYTLEFWEVKGFMRDDANVKIKVAAQMFPHVFRLCKVRAKKHGGGWEIKTIGGE
jgi:hypothetical protein